MLRFLLLSLSLSLGGVLSHSCDHEKIMIKPKITGHLDIGAEERTLQSWRNMRIIVDYSNLNKDFSKTDNHSLMIQYVLMNQIVDSIQTNMKVNGQTTITGLDANSCDGFVTIPSNATKAIDADLIIFVRGENSPNEGYVAQATACTISEDTGRPTSGVINFNFANIETAPENLDKNFRVALHEIMHVLFFSPSLYEYFVGYSTTNLPYTSVGGVYTMRTPKLVDFAKSQLSCSSVTGVPLEDNGGQGSLGAHFERTWVGNELMSAQENIQMVISGYTAALIEDSGWYQLGSGFSEPLAWGSGEGCNFVSSSFINSQCSSSVFPEYCAPSAVDAITCTSDYQSVTACDQNTFTNSCVVALPSQTGYCSRELSTDFVISSRIEKKGAGSRCVPVQVTLQSGSVVSAGGCFPVTCSGGSVTVTVSGTAYTCTTGGQSIQTTNGVTITCPSPATFCTQYTKYSCGGTDCNGAGTCKVDGTCRCRYGFMGNTCSSKIDKCAIPSDTLCSLYTGLSSNPDPNSGAVTYVSQLLTMILFFALIF